MKDNLISIIIPIYNVEKYLKRCLDSVLNQTYTNLEIILIDDGSTDSSGIICDDYALKDNRIKVIHKENEGQSIARNVGLENVTGKYISFIDADDMIDLQYYDIMLKEIIKNNVKMIACDVQRFDDTNIEEKKNQEKQDGMLYSKKDAYKDLLCINPKINNFLTNKLYLKELFDDIRLPVKRIFEDLAIMYKLIKKCDYIFFINEKLYYYFDRNDSSSKKIASEFYIEKIKLVNKRQEVILSEYSDLKECLDDYRFRNSVYMFLCISRNKDKENFYSEILDKEYDFIKEYTKNNGFILSFSKLLTKYKMIYILLLINKKILFSIGKMF